MPSDFGTMKSISCCLWQCYDIFQLADCTEIVDDKLRPSYDRIAQQNSSPEEYTEDLAQAAVYAGVKEYHDTYVNHGA